MKSFAKWSAFFVILLIVATVIRITTEPRGGSQIDSTAFANVGQETQVLVSKQDSEGVLNEQINVDAADAIGAYSLERMKHHTAKILTEMGSNESADGITQGTVLVPNNGQNLIITRFSILNTNHALQVAGIQGGELTRVMCLSPRGDIEVIIAGKCADALKEQFEFAMPGSTT